MKNCTIITVIFIMFFGIGPFVELAQSAPTPKSDNQNVVVINTPLPVQGDVNITNTSLPINGSVSVTNEPLLVEVSNEQVFVRDTFAFSGGESSIEGYVATVSFTVPADKILVIETISVQVELPLSTQSPTLFRLNFNGGNFHVIPLFKQGGDASKTFVGAQQIKVYVNPGSTVNMLVRRDSDISTFNYYPNVSGYLIDADSPSLAP